VILVLLMAWLPADSAEVPSDEALLARAQAAVDRAQAARDDPAEARAAYQEAADCYQQLRGRGCQSADLYRNLGNAYYLTGKLPEAILAFRQGRALDPDDSGLRESLDYARGHVDYGRNGAGRPPPDDWPPWVPRSTPAARLLLGGALLAGFWIVLTRYWMTRHGIHVLLGGFLLLSGLALLISVPVEFYLHQRDVDRPLVVIGHDGVDLRTGDGDAYPPRENVSSLKGGMEAELVGRRTDVRGDTWLRIQLAGGETGWIRATDALVDEQTSTQHTGERGA
jgi:hypothetical protein